MFISPVLDVAIGVVFVFLLLSLICSSANELLELLLKNRARDLERGLRELVGDRIREESAVAAVYNHSIGRGFSAYSGHRHHRLRAHLRQRSNGTASERRSLIQQRNG